jgi:hypothetical protein
MEDSQQDFDQSGCVAGFPATWQECRCHPFLWPIGLRKKFILEFADAVRSTYNLNLSS